MNWKAALILICSLGLFLRVWHLGEYPATLYGDEQAFAWNAYNILLLGQDEYGTPYPLHFRSFDDYKAPIPVYLLVPFIASFGLNAFAIRLPIALAGAGTVLATYVLARQFFSKRISLITSFLLAVSPWHVHVSRGYFETTLSLLFVVWAVPLFLKSRGRYSGLLISHFLFALALYSYFTPRIVLPLLLPFLYIVQHRVDRKTYTIRKLFLSGLFLLFLLTPLIGLSVFSNGSARFTKLTSSLQSDIVRVVNRERSATLLPETWKKILHNKATVGMRTVKENYLEQLSINFWYLFGDSSLRYFPGNTGMFYFAELLVIPIGIYALLRRHVRFFVLFVGWILIAAVPSAIVGKPFGLRSLGILPAPFFFVGYGIDCVLKFFRRSIFVGVCIAVIFSFSLGSYLLRYYLEYPVYAATWWGYENKAAIDYALERSDQYDYVFLSNFYSGATLAYAVYSGMHPTEYRQSLAYPVRVADKEVVRLGPLLIGSLDLDEKRLRDKILPENTLYIGRPEEPAGEDVIRAPDDGRVLFVVHDTKQKSCYRNNLPGC